MEVLGGVHFASGLLRVWQLGAKCGAPVAPPEQIPRGPPPWPTSGPRRPQTKAKGARRLPRECRISRFSDGSRGLPNFDGAVSANAR